MKPQPKPAVACLQGSTAVEALGRLLPYNFHLEGTRGSETKPADKGAIVVSVRESEEMTRAIVIAPDGAMTTTMIYRSGGQDEPSTVKLFSESAVKRAYDFIVGNEKVCGKRGK